MPRIQSTMRMRRILTGRSGKTSRRVLHQIGKDLQKLIRGRAGMPNNHGIQPSGDTGRSLRVASGNGELFVARMGRYFGVPWIQWRTEEGGHRAAKGFVCPNKEVTVLSTLTLHSANKPVQEGGGEEGKEVRS